MDLYTLKLSPDGCYICLFILKIYCAVSTPQLDEMFLTYNVYTRVMVKVGSQAMPSLAYTQS